MRFIAYLKLDNPEGFLVWSCYEPGASIQGDKVVIEFYDYLTEKLYSVAHIGIKDMLTTAYSGFQGASRHYNRQSGNVFALVTPNLQQAKYGYSTVSRYIKGIMTT